MALVSCSECKAEISDQADTCPRCGARQANAARGRAILFGILLLFVIVILGQCRRPESVPPQPITPAPAQPTEQATAKSNISPPAQSELTGNCTADQRTILQAFLKSEGMTCDIVNYCGALSGQNIRVTCNGDNFAYRIRNRGAGYYVEFD